MVPHAVHKLKYTVWWYMMVYVPLGWDNKGSVGAKKMMRMSETKFSHEKEEDAKVGMR